VSLFSDISRPASLCWRKSGSDSQWARRLIFCARAESTGTDKQAADTGRLRERAAELYEIETGSAWRPCCGSGVNHRSLTASVIDSREYIAAKRRADTEVLAPAGFASSRRATGMLPTRLALRFSSSIRWRQARNAQKRFGLLRW
jgi:hypothetical protein